MKTQRLELTEAQAMDFQMVKERGYPKELSASTEAVLQEVAVGLCISKQSLMWAYADGLCDDDSGWKRLREKLLSKPVKLVKE